MHQHKGLSYWRRRDLVRSSPGLLVYIGGAWSLHGTHEVCAATPPARLSPPPFAAMQQAFQQVLHLRFVPAFADAARLKQEGLSSLEAHLTQGIIAYFQGQWQIHHSASSHDKAPLALVLEEGKRSIQQAPRDAWLKTMVGLAAVFMTLEAEADGAASLQHATLGRKWLQEALIADATMTDAHLGLGILYFAKSPGPQIVQHFWGKFQERDAEEALHHLQRASETGHFSQEVAQIFLLRLYIAEQRHAEAETLGQKLLEHYPRNGYIALWVGKSQYARHDFAACAATLRELAEGLEHASRDMQRTEARFDLYYFLGRALRETAHDEDAFEAFRQAINYDPRTLKDESLWAKYYLATLYERRGAVKTARQIYQTLLRGRYIASLHRQIEERLARLPEKTPEDTIR